LALCRSASTRWAAGLEVGRNLRRACPTAQPPAIFGDDSAVTDLRRSSDEIRVKLQAARQRAPRDFDWYPHDTLANILTIERLTGGDSRGLLDLAAGKPVLDIGCADGEMAFWLESLGCEVHAIDNPVTNFNSMLGVRALRGELHSKIQILEADLDSRFTLPAPEYGLAFALGLLYHLKNPFYLMERLSKHARHCFFSTAITEYLPGLYENAAAAPAAYLADVYEVNRDSTNYWFFTDAGFRRLLARSNWEVCRYLLLTDEGKSGPGSIAGQRAFCLARSKYVNAGSVILYGGGWHRPEEAGWRWTERKFAIRIESARFTGADEIRLELYVPEIVLAGGKSVTLRALANGQPLAPERFLSPGLYEYRRKLPVPAGESDVRIDFSLDRALPPDAADSRERGIIVRAAEACGSA